MASTMQWALQLVDRLSGPASKMASSVSNLEGKLASLGSAAESIGSTFSTLKNSVLGDIASKAGELGVAGAKLAIDAAAFREDTMVALTSLLGSETAASAMIDKIDALSDKLALDEKAVTENVQRLLASGFSGEGALKIVEAAADLAAVNKAAAGKFEALVAGIEAKGKFDAKSLTKLAGIGIRTEDVYAALAKTLGKSTTEVAAMLKAGQIDAETAIAAISGVVHDKFGGEAEKLANKFNGLWFRLKDTLGDLFKGVDIGPLENAIKAILDAVNGPAGKEVAAGIRHFFGEAFKVVGKLFEGPEGAKRLQETLHSAARAFEKAANVIEMVGPSFVAGIQIMLDILNTANEGVDNLAEIGKWILKLGGWLFDLAAAVVAVPIALFEAIWNAIAGAGDALSSLASSVGAALSNFGSSLFGEATSAGSSIVAGIAEGISSGAGAVYAAVMTLGRNLLTTFMASINAHSPSEDFKWAADFIPQGAAKGIAENDAPQVAAANMLSASDAAAVAGGGGGSGGAKAGGGKEMSLHLTFNGVSNAQELSFIIRREVGQFFEAMGSS